MSSEQSHQVESRPTVSTVGINGIFFLAAITALHFAADLLVPITFSILISLLLAPIVRYFLRWRIPATISAAILVMLMVGGIYLGLSSLSGPAEEWLEQAPRTLRDLQQKIGSANSQLSDIQKLAAEVDELSGADAPSNATEVIVAGPGLLENLMGGMPYAASFIGIVIFLTFFLLASGNGLLRRFIRLGRNWAEIRRIVTISRQLQSNLSRYLVTVTIINLILGAAVALTMHFLEVPNPILWGAMVYMLNFAPYVGSLLSVTVLTVVGLTTFEALTDALTVPAAFLGLTILEGQLLTPAIVGRRMSLSPIVVFLAVIFWGWLWGVPGALMAVPIVTVFKVLSDHIPRMAPIGHLLFLNDDPVPQPATESVISLDTQIDDSDRPPTTP